MAEEQAVAEVDTENTGAPEANQTLTEEAPQTETTPTEEAKPSEESKSPDRGLLSETEEKQESVPESYEDFKLGEGVELSAEDQEALKSLAKEQGLSQVEAEKAVGYSRAIVEQIAKEEAAAMEQFKEENKKAWESQPDHAQRTLFADKAVKALGKDVEQYLVDNGHLYDAKILTVLSELGKYMSEPSHIAGTETAPAGPSRIYSNSPELYS